mgnify:CR=1 FL=1
MHSDAVSAIVFYGAYRVKKAICETAFCCV